MASSAVTYESSRNRITYTFYPAAANYSDADAACKSASSFLATYYQDINQVRQLTVWSQRQPSGSWCAGHVAEPAQTVCRCPPTLAHRLMRSRGCKTLA